MTELEKKSYDLKVEMTKMCINAGKGHLTSALSCMDIMITLYQGGIMKLDSKNPQWEDRDRFILSKGQASPGLYTVLADYGFYEKVELEKFAKLNGMFSVHLQNSVPGVEVTAGSLGHAYALAVGIAHGLKYDNKLSMVYALLGDGELYEGSIWEAAMFASHHNLNNLVTIIDRNFQCTMDFTEDLLALEPLVDKWEAFGFNVIRLDGHNIENLIKILKPLRSRPSKKPTVIIADTIKGAGIDFLSCVPIWHGVSPSKDLEQLCLTQLEEGANINGK